jgi:cell division septation protein DedD
MTPVQAPALSVLSLKTPLPALAAKKAPSAPAIPAAKKESSTAAKSTGTKTPQASPSPAQVAASSGAAGGKYYYVLVNDAGKRSLEKVKTIVPDAYVENFPQGARIQMGAFKREAEATTLVEELKQQGISASIYHP